jgi:predicted nucleotidyltransferase
MSASVDISHLITVGVALCGWLAVHRFSAWRDRINHKRKMQTDFLVAAFQQLADGANRPFVSGAAHLKQMESALAAIQLFGSKN